MPIKNNSWLSLFLGFLAIPGAVSAQENEAPYDKVQEVFSGNKTVVGEQVDFPKENDSIRSVIVTMEPGERTEWHRHGTPLFAYILEGELIVTYEGVGERHYKKGDALLEAMTVTHQGHNTGAEPVRILAVFLEGDSNSLTIAEEAPVKN